MINNTNRFPLSAFVLSIFLLLFIIPPAYSVAGDLIFSDDAETGSFSDNWQFQFGSVGSYVTNRSYEGTSSIYVKSAYAYNISTATPLGYYYEGWFFDDGDNTDTQIVVGQVGSADAIVVGIWSGGSTSFYSHYDGSGWTSANAVAQSVGWHKVGITLNSGGGGNITIDDVLVDSSLNTGGIFARMSLASGSAGSNDAYFDNIRICDTFCEDAPAIVIDDFTFRDRFNNLKAEVFQGELFGFVFNASFDDAHDDSLVCNISYENMIATFDDYNTEQYIILNTTKIQQEIQYTHPNATDVLLDSSRFSLCREQGFPNASLYANSVFQNSWGGVGGIIPSCNTGNHVDISQTQNLDPIPNTVNLTLKCENCDSNTRLRLVPFTNDNVTLIGARVYLNHTDLMTYNETFGYYTYQFPHLYTSVDTDEKTATVNCNGTIEQFSFMVNPTNVTAELLEIVNGTTEVAFTDGVSIEANNENLTIIGNCDGGSLSYDIHHNLSYSNNTLITNQSTETLTVPYTDLPVNDNYISTLYCADADNISNQQTVSKTFSFNDSINPFLIWTFPVESNTSEVTVNTSATITLQGLDSNLFSVGVRCVDSLGVEILETEVYPINDTVYQISNATSTILNLGTAYCTGNATDSHTMAVIDQKELKRSVLSDDSGQKYLTFGNSERRELITLKTNVEVENFEIIEKTDRVSFEPIIPRGSIPKTLRYDLLCNTTLYHITNSNYNGHFVCGNLWIDFDTEGIKDYTVNQIDDHKATVYLHAADKTTSLRTNSVGFLNQVEQTVSFEVVAPEESVEFTTALGIKILVAFIIWAVILIIGLWMRSLLIILCGCLIGLFVGFILVDLSVMISVIFIILNTVLAFLVVFGNKYE